MQVIGMYAVDASPLERQIRHFSIHIKNFENIAEKDQVSSVAISKTK